MQGGAPVVRRVEHAEVDLAHHTVDDGVEQVVLGGEVVVQRGTADRELGGEAAGGEGGQALGVDQGEGGGDDAVPAEQGGAGSGDLRLLGCGPVGYGPLSQVPPGAGRVLLRCSSASGRGGLQSP
ncbi:hypothetical protein Kpho02_04700 [Kitasatospora phosalacinea]|uniref:Uncharacterized protein n=1 Tax=Kitasatospora phosalacinea TaxID=2065 RepID=A0A9W6Q3L6_9ACTN|nr:hypothetical protein Kpho02_04700 [Kitasatospora phosalacinea]